MLRRKRTQTEVNGPTPDEPASAKQPRSGEASDSDLERLPDDILLAVYRDVVRTEGVLGLVRSVGAASRRLRSLCWQPAIFEEPELSRGPADACSAPLLEWCFRHAGEHVRRLCLSGLFVRGVERDAKLVEELVHKLLSLAPALSHLSLAHMRCLHDTDEARGNSWAALMMGMHERDPNVSLCSLRDPIIVRELPPLRSLHTLNLSDIVVSSDALRGAVAGAAATLQRLYLANTLVISNAPACTSVLTPLAGLRLPQLRALDLSHSIVEANCKALVEFVNAHPSLTELYIARLKLPPTERMTEAKWDSFVQLTEWPSPKYTKLRSRLERRDALAIFDSELHNQAEQTLFKASSNEGACLLEDAGGVAFLAALGRVPKNACAGLDARDGSGRTALIEAVRKGNLKFARRLQELGADPLAVCHPHPHFAASPAKRWGSPFPFFPRVAPSSPDMGKEGGATALHLEFHRYPHELPQDPEALAEMLRSLGLAPLVNARTRLGKTPLHIHAKFNHGSAFSVSSLLRLGANPFLKDAFGDNALFVALCRTSCGEVVRALLGAHPGLFRTTDAQGRSPLERLKALRSVSSGTIWALVDAGVIEDPEALAAALHVAVGENAHWENRGRRSDRPELLPFLLARPGADPNARGTNGRTLLMEAISAHNVSAQQMLLADPQLDVSARDDAGRTALHYAVMGYFEDNAAIFSELLDRRVDVNAIDCEGSTALHLLLRPMKDVHFEGFRPTSMMMLSALLEHADVDINIRDCAGRTPLFLAVGSNRCRRGTYGGVHDHRSEPSTVVKLLLGRPGINVNAATEGGQTPLWHACSAGLGHSGNAARAEADDNDHKFERDWRQRDVVKTLVAKGARPEPLDEFGMGLLHYVVTTLREDAVADALAAVGDLRAACALRNRRGRTPLMLACRRGRFEVARKLLPYSDAAAQDAEGNGALHLITSDRLSDTDREIVLELLRACPAAARVQNMSGETALHVYALRKPWAESSAYSRNDFGELARALVAASDLLALDAAGRTPLHVAAKGGSVGLLLRAMLESPQAAAALCVQDRLGATPLHVACGGGRVDVAKALLVAAHRTSAEAAVHCMQDNLGATPLHVACRVPGGRRDLVKALMEAMHGAGPAAAGALELRDANGLRPLDAAPAFVFRIPLLRQLAPATPAADACGSSGYSARSDADSLENVSARLPDCAPFPMLLEDE
eukprot:tig00000849_g4752.t1